MTFKSSGWKGRWRATCLFIVVVLTQAGCDTTSAIISGVVGTTVFTGLSPSNSLEQVYYLGIFDPQEQVPPNIYRVTVRGQASAISFMRFGSGWVPAKLVDSLNTQIGFGKDSNRPQVFQASDEELAELKPGRRMVLFGPEGFREAPEDHRLVIVMGASPEKYFEAIDEALGVVAQVQAEQSNTTVRGDLLKALLELNNQQERLKDLEVDVKLELVEAGE